MIIPVEIKSPAFKNGEYIPQKYSCQGEAVNSALVFEAVPAGAKSLVLIVDDPDAPGGTFDHWLVFNIARDVRAIGEGETPKGSVPGKNSAGKVGYYPPCPPPGKPHRYFFKLYALKAPLPLKVGATKLEVERAMRGLILAEASMFGFFSLS